VTPFERTIAAWRAHPSQMVVDLFGVTPDPWQHDALEAFPHKQRIAMKSSKGPGKSTVEAWIAWNFLLTRPHPKIAATSISADNLADGLWTEMSKWQQRSELLKQTFTWTKTRIFANDHPETWWMAARSWSRTADKSQQADTLAGLHADYILFVLDESGGIPDSVMAAAEAALASGIESHIVQAGNPTMLSGPLYRAFSIEARLWHRIEVTSDPDNPKRSPRVSLQWAKEQIEKYGRDNPWVMVNVLGQFPPSSLNSLIGPDEVAEATKRYYREFEIGQAPLVFGVDVARFGDDASVIFPRRGIQAFAPRKLRNVDSTQGAGTVARMWQDQNADAVFIDDTGGFGSGWIDQLRLMGRTPIGVHFAGKAHNAGKYANKRAEIYFEAVEWIKRGGALPDVPELAAALTQTTYTFAGDKLMLEPKDDIKAKLGYSPDEADAFVLSFAEPVSVQHLPHGWSRHQAEYDPFANIGRAVRNSIDGGYDPYEGNR
jgi:hypothetical protein